MSCEWQLRRSGATVARSSIPNLGYPPHILKDMARHGIHLYHNGKKVKPPPVVTTPKAAQGDASIPSISNIGGIVKC